MRERYLRSVRNLLDCPSNEKERLLQRLNSAVAAYLGFAPQPLKKGKQPLGRTDNRSVADRNKTGAKETAVSW